MQMPGHGEKITRKQDAFLAALLIEPTVYGAALRVGINEATAYRWLRDLSFSELYREARRELVTHAICQAQKATGEAVQTLRDVMADEAAPASARVSASKTLLEFSIKVAAVEDLEARIAALESHKE